MSKMWIYPLLALACACSNNNATPDSGNNKASAQTGTAPAAAGRHFEGTVTKGIQGTISFDVSAQPFAMALSNAVSTSLVGPLPQSLIFPRRKASPYPPLPLGLQYTTP